MTYGEPPKTSRRKTATGADQVTITGQPLAPFNNAEPFELAVLAVLLSGGKHSEKSLPAAASLWAQAYAYREELRWLYHGSELHKKWAALDLPAFAYGENEQWMSLQELKKTYPWGNKHWRQCLKDFLPPHLFGLIWKPPIAKIRIPKTVADIVVQRQQEKRSNRSR